MSYEDFLIRESVGDGTFDPDDVCYVCDKRDCECPPEDEPEAVAPKCAAGCGRPALDGHMTCGLAGCNEGAHQIDNQ